MPDIRPHRALALALAAALLLGACGDDAGTDAAATDTSTTAPEAAEETSAPTTTVPASTDPARKAQAEAAVLALEDLPDGFDEQDPAVGLGLEQVWSDVLDCLGVAVPAERVGIATSPTWLKDLATQARSTVEYMPEPQAQAIAAALAGAEFDRCATEAFTADAARSAPEGAEPGAVSVAPLEFAPLGASTSATRASVTMNLDDLQVPIVQDLVVVFDGEAVSRLMFVNPGGPFPPGLQRTLVETVAGRA